MADNTIRQYISINWPFDLISAIGGAVIGMLLAFIYEWIRKPTIKYIGFDKINTNFGILYKLRFKVGGFKSPGVCRMLINWESGNVYAKWDETPNPLENDNLNAFKPEMVPATFDQELFSKNEYNVPIVIESNGRREIFSGWWFGHRFGYGPNPTLPNNFSLTLRLTGTNILWERVFTEQEICR